MINNSDIEYAVTQVLKEETQYECYSNEVTEGFQIPCFFLKAKTQSTEAAGISTVKKTVRVIINYFGPFGEDKVIRDEEERQDMTALLYSLFRQQLKVIDRVFLITDQADELGGDNQDILIFTFNIEFFDDFDIEDEETDIEDVSVAMKLHCL